MVRGLLILSLLMLGCSGEIPTPRPPGNLPAMDADVLLLGEMHGTKNAPAFLLETIRAIPTRPIAIGFEIPVSMQEHVDTFLESDGSEAAQKVLLSHSFWSGGHDGRSSEALFETLLLLRKLRLEDAELNVFLFDAGLPHREKAMADLIIERARKSKTIALVGNVHARTKIGVPWNPKFKPMGWFVSQSISTQSFNINGADGEAWFCRDRRCGVHKLTGTAPENSWTFHHFEDVDDRGFLGEFHVGTYRASHPKVPPESAVQ